MTQLAYMVICNNGDGSNSVMWLHTKEAVKRVNDLADAGDEQYASGDGLQIKSVAFPDEFALDAWVTENFHGWSDEDVMEKQW